MNENNNEQYATRTLLIHDFVSGEDLLIAYFPEADGVTINGSSVTRSPDHKDIDGQAVFHRPLGNKLLTVDTYRLSERYI